jgi:hypothetical protein
MFEPTEHGEAAVEQLSLTAQAEPVQIQNPNPKWKRRVSIQESRFTTVCGLLPSAILLYTEANALDAKLASTRPNTGSSLPHSHLFTNLYSIF